MFYRRRGSRSVGHPKLWRKDRTEERNLSTDPKLDVDVVTQYLYISEHVMNSMELSLSRAAASFAAIPSILWNQSVHNRVHKSSPSAPILSQIKPIRTKCSTYLRLGLPGDLFPSGFHTKILYAFLLSLFRLHSLPNLSSLTSLYLYWMRSTCFACCSVWV
jgi:hypothetical protein